MDFEPKPYISSRELGFVIYGLCEILKGNVIKDASRFVVPLNVWPISAVAAPITL